MSENTDFQIDHGVLQRYWGSAEFVKVPDGVKCICEDAFGGCKSLRAVHFPASMTWLETLAFHHCEALTQITVDAENPEFFAADGILYSRDMRTVEFCPGGKTGEIVIPGGVTAIGAEAFRDCSGLTEITLPDSITELGMWSFYNCTSLASFRIPPGVTELPRNVFMACGFPEIVIPGHVKVVGECAFEDCTMTRVTVAEGVTEIGWGAFDGCRDLQSVTLPDSVQVLGCEAFKLCKALTQVHLPEGIPEISMGTFASCSSLREITLPDSVREVKNLAFACCDALETVSVRRGTQIAENAFLHSPNARVVTR